MKNLRKRVLAGETLIGCFLNLGSSLTAEIVGEAGFDWVLIDLEHGSGTEWEVLHQLQALEPMPAAVVIRVQSFESQRFYRLLDLGAHGIMAPRISTPSDARRAMAVLRYPPQGVRGVAAMVRAAGFGTRFAEYFQAANQSLLGVIQIETEASLSQLDALAAVDGVDVLFIGPLDLSLSLGILGQFDHPRFLEAVKATSKAARKAGKAAGILIAAPSDFSKYWELGYRFIASGSDSGLLGNAARSLASQLKSARAAVVKPP